MNFKQLTQALATAATLLVAQPIHAETFYFHNDHLGTPQALTDDSGAVVWQGSYSPFGEVTETTDTVEQNIRFPGQYFEEETGLHYNYFRDYDPGAGRYIESDPIGLQGGINTFGYVSGNPVSKFDVLGLKGCCDKGGSSGAWKGCVDRAGRWLRDCLKKFTILNDGCEATCSYITRLLPTPGDFCSRVCNSDTDSAAISGCRSGFNILIRQCDNQFLCEEYWNNGDYPPYPVS